MRLSPLDIRQQQFSVRVFRGLDPREVDTFLDDVAEDYEALLRENTFLKEQIAAHEERARGIADIERTLRDTLVTTQKLAEEIKAQARRDAELLIAQARREADVLTAQARQDADLIIREAHLQSEKGVEEARAEAAKLRHEIGVLRKTRRLVLEDLRGTLDRYYRVLDQDAAELGNIGDGDEP